MKIKKISETEFYLRKDVIKFKTEDGIYEIDSKDVLELAYALFDSLGLSYEKLEEADDKLNGNDLLTQSCGFDEQLKALREMNIKSKEIKE